MLVESAAIADVKIVTPKRFGDDRGWFSETYRADAMQAAGVGLDFVQDNQSFSAQRGTVRGLHFQLAPAAQSKLVRVLAGSILDVAIDIRPESKTYLQHVALELSASNGLQLLVPAGFAHGFCTLEPDTMVAYKVDAYYSPAHDRNLLWNDPALGLAWPVTDEDATVSEKDRRAPTLAAYQAAVAG